MQGDWALEAAFKIRTLQDFGKIRYPRAEIESFRERRKICFAKFLKFGTDPWAAEDFSEIAAHPRMTIIGGVD